jgi:hypothetical protein
MYVCKRWKKEIERHCLGLNKTTEMSHFLYPTATKFKKNQQQRRRNLRFR